VTVTALDAFGNVATGYAGTVHFSSSDASATLPPDFTFSAADQGVHTFTGVVLNATGVQTVSVADSLSSAVAGSAGVTVSNVAPSGTILGLSAFSIDEAQTVTPTGIFTHPRPPHTHTPL